MMRCHRCQTVIAAFFFCLVVALCRKWRQTFMTAQNIEHIPAELVIVKEAVDIGAKDQSVFPGRSGCKRTIFSRTLAYHKGLGCAGIYDSLAHVDFVSRKVTGLKSLSHKGKGRHRACT